MRICSVEAVALLLTELGEPQSTADALCHAVRINNDALQGASKAGLPVSSSSGAAKRRRRGRPREEQVGGAS